MARTLAPGQRSRIHTIDIDSGGDEVVFESTDTLFEAPNWTLDGSRRPADRGVVRPSALLD